MCNSAFETTEILKLKADHRQFDVEMEKNKQTIIGLNQQMAHQKLDYDAGLKNLNDNIDTLISQVKEFFLFLHFSLFVINLF